MLKTILLIPIIFLIYLSYCFADDDIDKLFGMEDQKMMGLEKLSVEERLTLSRNIGKLLLEKFKIKETYMAPGRKLEKEGWEIVSIVSNEKIEMINYLFIKTKNSIFAIEEPILSNFKSGNQYWAKTDCYEGICELLDEFGATYPLMYLKKKRF